MNLLKIRKILKSRKPKFLRQNWFRLKRLGEKWRRPKGRHSKLRRSFKAKGFKPDPGYGSPREVRGLHPCGLKEVLVFRPQDLEKINPEKECARISAKVGKKKRMEILKKAEELKIKVLNKGVENVSDGGGEQVS
ncbi:MAG: 50S ribosomal protein L32e [Candidatus Micrarchaeota archaeon]|nr:50S ribosomal protein L32e [Candidatus Micrarchaeota archaeon]